MKLLSVLLPVRFFLITGLSGGLLGVTLVKESRGAEVQRGAEAEKVEANRDSSLQVQKVSDRIKEAHQQVSTSAKDLLIQQEAEEIGANVFSLQIDTTPNLFAQGVIRVTGVQVKQTDRGLELILETVAGSERLVPSILPEGNDLVVDISNSTLAFAIRNGVEKLNPVEGINKITVNKIDESSIRVRISGTNQTPSAEVVSGSNLVLNVNPQRITAESPFEDKQAPDKEIEIVVTGEREEDRYNVPNATTATRTDTPLQDIPQSIQVIPQQVIEDQQANNITEALRNVPGTVPSSSTRSQFDTPIIRGFGGDSATNDLFRRNGLRDGLGTSNTGDTANVERIEVLKGPASVLYGQGSPGGVVNIVTKQPLSNPFYAVEVGIGNYDFYRGAFDLSGPLDEQKNVLYRLNFSAESAGSFVDFYDRDRYLVNPVIAWQIGDNTELTFEYEYRNLQQPNDFGLPAVGTILDNPNGDIPVERFIGEPDIEERRDIQSHRFGYNLEHRFSENWRIRNAFDAVLRTENSIAIFADELGEDGRTLEREYFDSRNGFDINNYILDTYTVGKFNTGSIKHELVAGIELSRDETIFNDNFGGSLDPIDLFDPQYGIATLSEPDFFLDSKDTKDGLGIYLQDQITLSDKFIVLLGGRFDILSTKAEDFVEDTVNFQQNEGFSPRVGLVYKPIEDISLYASYSRSLTQSVGTAFDGGIFEPERGTQYEIGVKGDISDRLSATLALYDLTRTNVTTEDPDDPNFEIQTGEQNSQGIELSVAGEISPGWNVTAGYAYTDAVITEDNTFEEGNRLNNAPENAVSLWTTYKLQKGSLEGLGFGLGIFFVGERQGDLDNSFQLPSYTRTDAAIFYERGKIKTAINFRNLFDIDYFETAENDLRVYPGTPFTVLGSVSFKF
jgi:iron complex outermembrane recepter protein